MPWLSVSGDNDNLGGARQSNKYDLFRIILGVWRGSKGFIINQLDVNKRWYTRYIVRKPYCISVLPLWLTITVHNVIHRPSRV